MQLCLKISVTMLLLLIGGCAGNPESAQSGDWIAIAEKINLKLPENFKEIYRHKNNDNSYIIEYIPDTQKLDDWKEMITVLYLPLPNADAERIYYGTASSIQKICEDFSLEKAVTFNSPPYTVIRGSTSCGKNPKNNLGEYTYYSVAKGITGIHILQRAVRTKPFSKGVFSLERDEAMRWAKFYNDAALCTYVKNKDTKCVRL